MSVWRQRSSKHTLRLWQVACEIRLGAAVGICITAIQLCLYEGVCLFLVSLVLTSLSCTKVLRCRFETNKWGHQKAPVDLQKPSLDLRLYAVTDPACNARCQRSNAEAVQQAIQGGVTLVQLREKSVDGGAFVNEAQQLVDITRPAGVCHSSQCQ